MSLEPRVVKCTAIENMCAHVYPSLTMFFRLGNDNDALVQYDYLRRGLSRALYEQQLLTGILEQDERGAFSVAIPVHAGVRFHYCDLSQDRTFPDFEQFAKAGFPYADGNLDGLSKFRPDPFPTSERGDPVLVPQLTHLNGGLVLTCSISHLVTDVFRAVDFVVRWAASTREVAEAVLGGRPDPPIPMQLPEPLNDRLRLLPPPRGCPSLDDMKERCKTFPNFKVIDPDDPVGTIADLHNFQTKCHIASCAPDKEEFLRETISGVWHFSQADIKAIHLAAQTASPHNKVSTMDVFIAFLWSRYFAAKYPYNPDIASADKGYHGSIPQDSAIVCAADIRSKLTPPLPSNYMGVAVDLLRAHAPATALTPGKTEDSNEHLARVAIEVRQSNATWDEKEFMATMEMSQQTPRVPGFVPKGPIELLITDHRKGYAIIAADWGPGLGKLVGFREPYVGRTFPAGEITMFPGLIKGDIDVMIASERAVIERLCADPEMRRRSTNEFLMHDVIEAHGKSMRRSAKL